MKQYRVIINAPDGRFGQKIIEGGLDKHTAEWTAKQYRKLGVIADVMPMPEAVRAERSNYENPHPNLGRSDR